MYNEKKQLYGTNTSIDEFLYDFFRIDEFLYDYYGQRLYEKYTSSFDPYIGLENLGNQTRTQGRGRVKFPPEYPQGGYPPLSSYPSPPAPPQQC